MQSVHPYGCLSAPRPANDPNKQPGHPRLIAGNGGVYHGTEGNNSFDRNNQRNSGFGDQRNSGDQRGFNQRDFGDQRQSGFDRNNSRVNQPRSYMSRNGDRDRAVANRGRDSMHPAAMHQRVSVLRVHST